MCWAVGSPDGRRLARAWDGGGLNLADVGGGNSARRRNDLAGRPRRVLARRRAHRTRGQRRPLHRPRDQRQRRCGVAEDWQVPNAAWVGFSPDSEHVAAIGSQWGTGIVALRSVRDKGRGLDDRSSRPGANRPPRRLPSSPPTANGCSSAPAGPWSCVSGRRTRTPTAPAGRTDRVPPGHGRRFGPLLGGQPLHRRGDGRPTPRRQPPSPLTACDLGAFRPIRADSTIHSEGCEDRAMELSPDGHWLAVGDYRGDIRLIDFNTGQSWPPSPATTAPSSPSPSPPTAETSLPAARTASSGCSTSPKKCPREESRPPAEQNPEVQNPVASRRREAPVVLAAFFYWILASGF